MIRVELPYPLRVLARIEGEVAIDGERTPTLASVLDAIEARYPVLGGTIRDHTTRRRRPFVRFYACGEDLSNESPDATLPEAVVSSREPLVILGAIAGG